MRTDHIQRVIREHNIVLGFDLGNVHNYDRLVSLKNLPPELMVHVRQGTLKVGDKIPSFLYEYRQEVPLAVRKLGRNVRLNGPERVKFFKNSLSGWFNNAQALAWMDRHDIYRRTGLLKRNIYFPETRKEKIEMCLRENVTDLVEDRADVVRHLPVDSTLRCIVFNPDLKEFCRTDLPSYIQRRMRIAFNHNEVEQLIYDRTWGFD